MKTQLERTTYFNRKVATILHIDFTIVVRCIKNETYKTKRIDDFFTGIHLTKIYKLYETIGLPTNY